MSTAPPPSANSAASSEAGESAEYMFGSSAARPAGYNVNLRNSAEQLVDGKGPQGFYMHASCFVDLAAWYETQTNLRDILHAWALCSRRARRLRITRALRYVRMWQREKWMEWADTMCTRSSFRSLLRTFTLWATHCLPPPLVDSSEDD